MKTVLFIITFLSISFRIYSQQQLVENEKGELKGFVFVDISKAYHSSGHISILDLKKDTILTIENKSVSINGKNYETIEEEYLYRKLFDIEVLEAEYGFFILKCYGETDGFYKVGINSSIGLVPNNATNSLTVFKDLEKYIMETHPIPTKQNPLRQKPNENSEIVKAFEKWTYLSVEIVGDWLKVTDNKDCYSGASPSTVDIVGWIRWRKDGKFILKVAHSC